MQPAPTIVSPRMITAPSCSGEYGVKIVASRSADTFACISEPDSHVFARATTSRSIAMIAPMPERLSRSTASATSSATSLSSMRRKKRDIGDRPICASAARSSGAKTTSSAIAP